MSIPSRSLKSLRGPAVGLLGLALQACRTFSGAHATVETPYVLSFEFEKPVEATTEEKDRFEKALKHAVPEKSKLFVGDEQVWPPTGRLKTDRVISGVRGERGLGFVTKTQGTANPARPFTRNTQMPTLDKAVIVQAKSTQHLSFASEQDMRAFFKALAGSSK